MKCDAIVIGSGQGGTPLARARADLGWTVAFIEERHLHQHRLYTNEDDGASHHGRALRAQRRPLGRDRARCQRRSAGHRRAEE